MTEQNENQIPTCMGCIYDVECAWAVPNAHWSDCGIWGKWDKCVTCDGSGALLRREVQTSQDFSVACHHCFHGYIKRKDTTS